MLQIIEAFYECYDKMMQEEHEATARIYRTGLNVFMEYLDAEHGIKDSDPVEKLTIDVFIRFPSWLARSAYRRSTDIVYMSAADYFLERYLIINRIISPDVVDMMRYTEEKRHMMKKQDEYKPRNVTEKDVQRMITAVSEMTETEPRKSRDIALVLLLASSGIRNEEATKLRVRDITWNSSYEKPFVHIENGKGGKSRDIPFSKVAWDALKAYWKERGWSAPDDPVFARHDKGAGKRKHKPVSTQTIRNIIGDVHDLSGMEGEFTPHYFRHGVATKILRKTGNIEIARQQLGHSNIGTTALYTHLLKDDLVDGHNKAFDEE